jgi:hypothetical protein
VVAAGDEVGAGAVVNDVIGVLILVGSGEEVDVVMVGEDCDAVVVDVVDVVAGAVVTDELHAPKTKEIDNNNVHRTTKV